MHLLLWQFRRGGGLMENEIEEEIKDEIKLISGDVVYANKYIPSDDNFIEFVSDYVAENGVKYRNHYVVPLTSIVYIKTIEEVVDSRKGGK